MRRSNLRPARRSVTLAAGVSACLWVPLATAQPSVLIDMTGASIPSSGSTAPDIVRSSAPATISPASGYRFTFNPTVQPTGFLGIAVLGSSPRPLGDIFNTLNPGQYRLVYGAVRNPAGTHPITVYRQNVAGTFSGIAIGMDISVDIQANNVGVGAIRNIVKPVFFGLNVTSGGASINIDNTLPSAIRSEWQLNADLLSVRENGSAPASGPSLIRYLDSPAFGTILGGPGRETQPLPSTPTGVTQAQSAFGTCSSFGLPLICGVDDTVYRTSPTRNVSDPGNRDLSRGLGLALWPNTRDTWPDDKIGHWTLVLDVLIPASSWASEYPVAFFEDNHNNDSSADAFVRKVGAQGTIGAGTPFDQYLTTPLLAPSRWMRVAFVSDGYRAGTGRIYIDGQLIGATGGDWIYNSTKSADPRWGDTSTANPMGTPVAPATWQAWGQFPSPWAYSGTSVNAPMASTLCLFADLQGRGEAVYVANIGFADEALTAGEIAALGSANARGIWYPAPPAADCNANGVDDACDIARGISLDANQDGIPDECAPSCASCPGDYNASGGVPDDADVATFFNDWNDGLPCADVNMSGGTPDDADVGAFFDSWNSGC